MVRLVTETMDPKDFLLFSQPGGGSFTTPSPLVDFEAVLNTGNNMDPVLILSTLPAETSGGIFFRYRGGAGNVLTTDTLIRFKADTSLLGELRINAGNDKLEILSNGIVRDIGSQNIQIGTNYHAQWRYKVSNTVGVFEIKLDEDLDLLTFSGDTTGAGGSYVNRYELPASNSGTFVESLYINDTSGAEDNGYGGVVRMISAVPPADGFYQDWPLTSGSDGFAMVNQTPHDGDTTIAYSNVNGDKVSFTVAPHGLSSPAVIKAVSARWVVRKVSNGRVRPFYRIGGVDYPIVAASVPVGVGYCVVMDRRTTNPATGLPWALGDTIDSVGLEAII